MAKKSLIYLVYSDLVSAVNGIGKKTYLDRPKSVTEELGYGTFSVFCKAKTDATINIGSQSELTQKVLDLFPINGKYITASRPRVLMQGEDGYGYQVTQITFSLHTKTNARNID